MIIIRHLSFYPHNLQILVMYGVRISLNLTRKSLKNVMILRGQIGSSMTSFVVQMLKDIKPRHIYAVKNTNLYLD